MHSEKSYYNLSQLEKEGESVNVPPIDQNDPDVPANGDDWPGKPSEPAPPITATVPPILSTGKDKRDPRDPVHLSNRAMGVFSQVQAPIHKETREIMNAFNPSQSTFTIEDIAWANIKKGSKINPLPIDRKPAFINAAD